MSLVTSWPSNFPGIGLGANRLANRIQSLSNNEIRDISVLKSLTNLEKIHLTSNKIQDINFSFIEDLPKLEILNLKENKLDFKSRQEIEKIRLKKRKTETENKINMRISKASAEMATADLFDLVIENKILKSAQKEARNIVLDFIKS